MARKPKAQLHPDVAAALPVALAALDDAPMPARPGRKARADAPSPKLPAPGRDDTAPSRAKKPAAVAAPAPEAQPPKPRGPTPRTPEPAKADAPEPQLADAAGADPVPTTDSAVPGDGAQPPLPGLQAPPSAQPAAHWDRAADAVRFDWPAIERAAAANGPNQGMAKLLVAARAEGANSRWPL